MDNADIDLSDAAQTSFDDLYLQYEAWRNAQFSDDAHKELVDQVFVPILDELAHMVELLSRSK